MSYTKEQMEKYRKQDDAVMAVLDGILRFLWAGRVELALLAPSAAFFAWATLYVGVRPGLAAAETAVTWLPWLLWGRARRWLFRTLQRASVRRNLLAAIRTAEAFKGFQPRVVKGAGAGRRKVANDGVRYDVKLRDPNGRMYQQTFRTKKEAETYETNELSDRARGRWVDPRGADTPFGTFATEWLASDPSKRPSSLARDETIVRVHLKPKFGERPLGSIMPKDVQGLVNEWCKTQKPHTIHRQHSALSAIFNAAVERDLIGRSPCRGIKLPAIPKKKAHIVDADELVTLAHASREGTRPMPYVGAVIGPRWGECAGLKVGRLDFLRGLMTIDWQRTRGPGGVMVEGPPKSAASERTLAVPKLLMDMLAEHLARRGLTAADADAYVFVGPDGGPLDYSDWYHRDWKPACRRRGFPA